jgi:23S rRNA (cytosine1962-C5)-methyltransferase
MSSKPEDRIYSDSWKDYALMDAGGGKKLERWGDIITIRPEVQAYFKSEKSFKEWEDLAHWEFVQKKAQSGSWKALKKDAPRTWSATYGQLCMQLEITKFKHVGLFPEQRANWDFIQENCSPTTTFLNLFAYTGAASIAARMKQAEVVHVDSVKQLVSWANGNMALSKTENIKWVVEDALKFAARERKRGKTYTGISMDPPAWGIGAKGEKWKLEDKLEELLEISSALLAPNGFLILNTYSPTIDLRTIQLLARNYFTHRKWEVKELWMKSISGKEVYYGNVLRVFPNRKK